MPVVQRTNEYGNNSNSLAVPANSVTKQTSTSSIDSGASSATTSSSNSSQRSAILSINEEIKLKFQTNSLFRKQRQHPESGDSVNGKSLSHKAKKHNKLYLNELFVKKLPEREHTHARSLLYKTY